MPITYRKFEKYQDALEVCSTLASVSSCANKPFCQIYQDLMSCVLRGQYEVQTRDNSPVGFYAWIKLDATYSEIYKNNLRWIETTLHDEKGFVWVDMFCTGLSGDAKHMLERLRENIPDEFIGYRNETRSIDLRPYDLNVYNGILF